jgi:ABC-type uncharacterized transport system auxiliary subunit
MRLRALLIAALLISAGCSKKALIRKYYILESPSIPAAAEVQPEAALPYLVDIRDFRVSKAFDQTRIAMRTESHELNYYYYHHWAVRPSTAFADFVFQAVNERGLFRRCSRGYSYNPDYLINGIVRHVERGMGEKDATARLGLVFELADAEQEVVRFRHAFDRTLELENDRDMNSFARAVSRILAEETQVFMDKLVDFFRDSES